jgi:hypothetical protein
MASRIDRVHVSWTKQLDVDAYIDDYLRRRRKPVHGITRAAVTRCMARYVGGTPVTRADLDFFLDANLRALVP